MNNTRRREVYLRDRSELTPAQSRRLAKHETRVVHDVAIRASRVRKSYDKQRNRQLRWTAVNLIGAMRSGMFSPRRRDEAEAHRLIDTMRSAINQQNA